MSTDTPTTAAIALTEYTAFQRDLLRVLAGEAQHGLGIKADLEAEYGKEINHGRLYPNLNELVQRGVVSKQSLDGRTNLYALTRTGQLVLSRYASEWESARQEVADD